jgi:hypothetical protein
MQPIIPLVLQTRDLVDFSHQFTDYNDNITTRAGSITHFKSLLEFNIDMKLLLGEYYDRYDTFALQMTDVRTLAYTNYYNCSFNDKPYQNNFFPEYYNLNMWVSGLDWTHVYHQKLNSGYNEACICSLANQTRSITNVAGNNLWRADEFIVRTNEGGYDHINEYVFRKEPIVKIKLSFASMSTGLTLADPDRLEVVADSMQHVIAKFNISPFQ